MGYPQSGSTLFQLGSNVKEVRYVTDFIGSTPVTPFATSTNFSATLIGTTSHDVKHPCIGCFRSVATEFSGIGVGVSAGMLNRLANPVLTMYFKLLDGTPNTVFSILGLSTSSNSADKVGLEIQGFTARAKNTLLGVSEVGPDITLTPETWYIARVKLMGTADVVCEIYTDTGELLYSHTLVQPSIQIGPGMFGMAGIRAYTTSAEQRDLLHVDLLELYLSATERYYLPHN